MFVNKQTNQMFQKKHTHTHKTKQNSEALSFFPTNYNNNSNNNNNNNYYYYYYTYQFFVIDRSREDTHTHTHTQGKIVNAKSESKFRATKKKMKNQPKFASNSFYVHYILAFKTMVLPPTPPHPPKCSRY
jgi:hypothetical protein